MLDDSTPFEGVLHGVYGKSHKFEGDFWDEAEFIPSSQCEWEPDPSSDTPGKGTLHIKNWLVKKNRHWA